MFRWRRRPKLKLLKWGYRNSPACPNKHNSLELPDRGLGNAPAVRGLLRCHIAEEADILFLLETKLDEKRMIVLKKEVGCGEFGGGGL